MYFKPYLKEAIRVDNTSILKENWWKITIPYLAVDYMHLHIIHTHSLSQNIFIEIISNFRITGMYCKRFIYFYCKFSNIFVRFESLLFIWQLILQKIKWSSQSHFQLLQLICTTFKLDLPFRRKSSCFGVMKGMFNKHIKTCTNEGFYIGWNGK
jgi:hypothetical protein